MHPATVQPQSAHPLGIVLLGAPGSGKGTQAAQLSLALGIPAISTGDMLRAECASGSVLGRSVESVLAAGRLVDDELMNEVVAARLKRPDCSDGFILDGYPRTVQQAGFLNEFLRWNHMPLPTVIHLHVSVDEVKSRLARRLQCPACGYITSVDLKVDHDAHFCPKDGATLARRADDSQEGAIGERVKTYESKVAGLVAMYRGRDYHRVYGARAISDVTREILALIRPQVELPYTGTDLALGHTGAMQMAN
jgi:adenylate kinase